MKTPKQENWCQCDLANPSLHRFLGKVDFDLSEKVRLGGCLVCQLGKLHSASQPIQNLSPIEASCAKADDLSELYRDLVLAQFHLGRISEGPAQKSIEQIDELFPPEIASRMGWLR